MQSHFSRDRSVRMRRLSRHGAHPTDRMHVLPCTTRRTRHRHCSRRTLQQMMRCMLPYVHPLHHARCCTALPTKILCMDDAVLVATCCALTANASAALHACAIVCGTIPSNTPQLSLF